LEACNLRILVLDIIWGKALALETSLTGLTKSLKLPSEPEDLDIGGLMAIVLCIPSLPDGVRGGF
jgi:hypothetical protein